MIAKIILSGPFSEAGEQMKQKSQRKKHIYVWFPKALLEEIDALAGPRKRSSFLIDVLSKAVQKRKPGL
jgi:hypothetical protein